jgi:uncharacterized membrane protein YfcA
MTPTPLQIASVMAIGLVGGMLGGLLGLGGSVFIIPALTLLLGTNQHLYQAAALITNVFVAAAATLRHRGRGTIRTDLIPSILFASSIAAIAGVALSNLFEPKPLAGLFGAYLCYASLAEMIALARKVQDHPDEPRTSPRVLLGIIVGLAGGFTSGFLGIGGGAVMVPLLRRFGRLPIRQAVATSATAMIVICAIGATAKNTAIDDLRDPAGGLLSLQDSLLLALFLTPAAAVGGHIGATLVYRIPITATRLVLAALLAVAGARMVLSGGADAVDRIRNLLGT